MVSGCKKRGKKTVQIVGRATGKQPDNKNENGEGIYRYMKTARRQREKLSAGK
jgi:hypothetical protein